MVVESLISSWRRPRTTGEILSYESVRVRNLEVCVVTLPVSVSVSTHRSRHRSKLLVGGPGQLLLLQHESRSHEETATQHLLLQVHTH